MNGPENNRPWIAHWMPFEISSAPRPFAVQVHPGEKENKAVCKVHYHVPVAYGDYNSDSGSSPGASSPDSVPLWVRAYNLIASSCSFVSMDPGRSLRILAMAERALMPWATR